MDFSNLTLDDEESEFLQDMLCTDGHKGKTWQQQNNAGLYSPSDNVADLLPVQREASLNFQQLKSTKTLLPHMKLVEFSESLEFTENALINYLNSPSIDDRVAKDLMLKLCQEYNTVSTHLLGAHRFEEALVVLTKARILCEHDGMLSKHPELLNILRGITYNNLGCYYKQIGKFKQAVHYLQSALAAEELDQIAENRSSTLLNLCAVLSSMGQHSDALQYGLDAVICLLESLGISLTILESLLSPLLPATASDNPETKGSSFDLAGSLQGQSSSKIQALAMAFFNTAVEYEHMQSFADALRLYKLALLVANKSPNKYSSMAASISKAIQEVTKTSASLKAMNNTPVARQKSILGGERPLTLPPLVSSTSSKPKNMRQMSSYVESSRNGVSLDGRNSRQSSFTVIKHRISIPANIGSSSFTNDKPKFNSPTIPTLSASKKLDPLPDLNLLGTKSLPKDFRQDLPNQWM